MANEVKTAKSLGLLTEEGLPVSDIEYVRSQMNDAFKYKEDIKLENIVLPNWPCNTYVAANFLVNYFQKILEPDLKLEDILPKKVYVSGLSKEFTEEIDCWALDKVRQIGIVGTLKPKSQTESQIICDFEGMVYSDNKSDIKNYILEVHNYILTLKVLKILGEA